MSEGASKYDVIFLTIEKTSTKPFCIGAIFYWSTDHSICIAKGTVIVAGDKNTRAL